jgi:transketolase
VQGLRFGMDGFGASAPAPDLFKHFGLTADAIAPKVLAAIRR